MMSKNNDWLQNGGVVTIGLREKTKYYISKQSQNRLLEYYTRIQQMCLMDDDFMRVILKDKECTEIVLQVILNKPDLKVEKVEVQYDMMLFSKLDDAPTVTLNTTI